MKPRVGVVRLETSKYPTESPYHPSEFYPEYPFPDHIAKETNRVYSGVRDVLELLELDSHQYGTRAWNPLGQWVEPGMTVVLKPNFVISHHSQGKDLYAAITHPAVLRAIADYVWIALRGHGQIIIADAPQYNCNWQDLVNVTQLDQVMNFYADHTGPQVQLLDLRYYWSRGKHFNSLLEELPGDPQGRLTVNLGKKSALYDLPHPDKLYGAVYQRDETIKHHKGETQDYEVSATVMQADFVISVPKLKVHKKVGVTLNVKGLVGICTDKNYLVHYSVTPPSQGGDQFPDGLFNPLENTLIRIERWMYDHFLLPRIRPLEYVHRSIYALHNHTTRRLGIKVSEEKRLLDAGNWYGNDSAWRMAVDLMKVFCFADRQGRMKYKFQRRMFSIIDGVIGGDHNGPLTPDPVPAGVLIAGENILAADIVATRLMGFDPLKMKLYQSLLTDPSFDFGIRRLGDASVLSGDPGFADCLLDTDNKYFSFTPHPGWVGYVEMEPRSEEQLLTHQK